MFKILKYSFYDMLRSRLSIIYLLFFLTITFALLYLSSDTTSAVISLLNVILIIVPLISTIFGTMHFYNSREFLELLLSQPIKRQHIFMGKYLGFSISLVISFLAGMIIPFMFYGIDGIAELWSVISLLLIGIALTFIFTSIAFLISISNTDKIKGFGLAILVWLFMAVIYDGLILVVLSAFREYPLENTAIFMSIMNPVDLGRIVILLQLDTAAIMGYTGAVFSKFFGSAKGLIISGVALTAWIIIPLTAYIWSSKRKDF